MKKNASLIYRSAWFIVAIIATVMTITDHVGASGDGRPPMLFYTSWSVWLATLAAILVCSIEWMNFIKKEEKSCKIVSVVEFCALIMMIATFIVSAFVLEDKLWTAGYWTAGSIFKHFLLPILTVVDVVLFERKNVYSVFTPLIGVITSLVYWFAVVLRAVIFRNAGGGAIASNLWDQYYPYGFTNFDNGHSLGGLVGMLAGILVGLIAIGYLFYFLNNKKEK